MFLNKTIRACGCMVLIFQSLKSLFLGLNKARWEKFVFGNCYMDNKDLLKLTASKQYYQRFLI